MAVVRTYWEEADVFFPAQAALCRCARARTCACDGWGAHQKVHVRNVSKCQEMLPQTRGCAVLIKGVYVTDYRDTPFLVSCHDECCGASGD